MNGQTLDNLYANATLNSDYTSTFNTPIDSKIFRRELKKWVINNLTKFKPENELYIKWGYEWYWGSGKTYLKSLTFVKSENLVNRKNYLEILKTPLQNSSRYSLTEILEGVNDFLKIPEVQAGGKFIADKVRSALKTPTYDTKLDSSVFDFTLSENNYSTLIYNVHFSTSIINISDGGIFSSNTNDDCLYSVVLYDKYDNLTMSSNDPFKDDLSIQSDKLPAKVVVRYCSSVSTKSKKVELLIKKGGNYIISLR